MVVFRQKWLYLCKMVVCGQGGCVRKKSGCIRAKVVVFGQMCLYSGKVVVFGQKYVFERKLMYSGKNMYSSES